MVFVPVVPPPRPPSGRALDLGRRLKTEVERFEKEYPGTSREDLRAAANLAIGEESPTIPARRRVAAILAGMMGALVALGVAMKGAAGQGAAPWPIMAMIVAVMIAGLAAVAVRRSRQE
jgi:hypothetical protein